MKRFLILAMPMLIFGCMNPNVAALTAAHKVDSDCRVANQSDIAGYRNCVKQEVPKNEYLAVGPHRDLVSRYFAGLDVLVDARNRNEITDTQAFFVAGEYYGHLQDIFRQRAGASEAAQLERDALAVQAFNAASQSFLRAAQPPPRTMPVICNHIGTQTICQ